MAQESTHKIQKATVEIPKNCCDPHVLWLLCILHLAQPVLQLSSGCSYSCLRLNCALSATLRWADLKRTQQLQHETELNGIQYIYIRMNIWSYGYKHLKRTSCPTHTCLKFCLLGLLKAFGHLFNRGDSKCTWQRSAAAVKIWVAVLPLPAKLCNFCMAASAKPTCSLSSQFIS